MLGRNAFRTKKLPSCVRCYDARPQRTLDGMAEKEGINLSTDNGTTIIIDDNFIYGVSIEHAFILAHCVCLAARKYQLTWKLKKAQWLPSKVEFAGVDIHKNGGNSPTDSKDVILNNWVIPTSPRHVMAFIGFAIFYLRWCPWFEMKIKPMRDSISDHTIDHVFTKSEFPQTAIQSFYGIRDYILSKPILQRANILKRFYLKADFCSIRRFNRIYRSNEKGRCWRPMRVRTLLIEETTAPSCIQFKKDQR